MSENFITTENVLRKCAVQRKMLPRTKLFRIVRTKQGTIFFDPEYKILGRGLHFSRDKKVVDIFFHPKKRGMISHFLKTNISEKQFEELNKEVAKML